MCYIDAAILGIIQGITEFLPVSSTAHVELISQLFHLHDFGKNFAILLNLGTLLALIAFFWKDFCKLFIGGINFLINKKTDDRDFFLKILLASIPTVLIFGTAELCNIEIKSALISGICLIVFGIVLFLCDRCADNKTKVDKRDGILIGIAQLLSFIPGVSRLGACLSMGRFLEYSREESFRFSMILSIPAAGGACCLKLLKIIIGQIEFGNWSEAFIGVTTAFVIGLITLSLVVRFFRTHSFSLIIIYRIFFGIFVLFHFFHSY